MAAVCANGHPLREISRTRIRETVEDVVYTTQLIKKFNRHGAEAMEQVKIPEFVPREVEVDVVECACDQCNSVETIRENEKTITQNA